MKYLLRMPCKLKSDHLKTHVDIAYGLVCVLKYTCHGEQDRLHAERTFQTLPANALPIPLICTSAALILK